MQPLGFGIHLLEYVKGLLELIPNVLLKLYGQAATRSLAAQKIKGSAALI